MKLKHIVFVFAFLGIVGWGPFSFFSAESNNESLGTRAWVSKELAIISSQASDFNPTVIKLALKAYSKARQQGYIHKQLLTIVDYGRSSADRRLLVVDLIKQRVLFNTWVTHGKNSGGQNATSFSNQNGSLKSSIGVFVTTSDPYVGGNGYSLRVRGLERGINDNAFRRDIVFHGAWYADSQVAKKYGTLGRSWGCFAVGENVVRPLINTIKDGSLVFAYYPDRHWLNHSKYLVG